MGRVWVGQSAVNEGHCNVLKRTAAKSCVFVKESDWPKYELYLSHAEMFQINVLLLYPDLPVLFFDHSILHVQYVTA